MAEGYDMLKEKYASKLKKQLRGEPLEEDQPIRTRAYEEFKKEYLPKHLSWYEKACNLSEKILNIKPDKKKIPPLQEAIDICHLNVTPTGATSLSFLAPMLMILFGIFLGGGVFMVLTGAPSMFFIMSSLLVGVVLMISLQKMPFFLANQWRLKASNQMVLCVFYVVTYIRHTANLELAIDFAAEHLSPPLSLDLKKVVWNVETEKFENVRESVEDYLNSWRKWNSEFIESMNLIIGSLYEGDESRRLNSLDKGLEVMLDETYEKMLHYAHNLKSPITMLHMLGIILPILGLVILPLVVSFMEGVKWYHLFTLYNILLPAGVFYMGKNILATRPTGYGETDISESKHLKKFKKVDFKIGPIKTSMDPLWGSVSLFLICMFIGFSPLLINAVNPCLDLTIGNEGIMSKCSVQDQRTVQYSLLDYRKDPKSGLVNGPYGIGAAVLSIAIPLGLGLSLGLYFFLRTKRIIKIRQQSKKLEQEFASALFQLGNRLGDGLPAEIAFSKVADVMEGTVSGKFFNLVSTNIRKLGYGVEQAIFDPQHGALSYYPSNLIESSMKVFVQSSRKGPQVAAQAMINVSEYIKQMHRVDERLKDLMADIISSMKSQIQFLTPAIAGIVIGITSMITAILGSLGSQIGALAAEGGGAAGGGLMDAFGSGVPTYYFQIIVGLYVVQIVYILSLMINGIQNGSDKLNERYLIGKNETKSTIIYCAIAFFLMLMFNIIAGTILGTIGGSVG